MAYTENTHPRCTANDGPSADEPVVRHVRPPTGYKVRHINADGNANHIVNVGFCEKISILHLQWLIIGTSPDLRALTPARSQPSLRSVAAPTCGCQMVFVLNFCLRKNNSSVNNTSSKLTAVEAMTLPRKYRNDPKLIHSSNTSQV